MKEEEEDDLGFRNSFAPNDGYVTHTRAERSERRKSSHISMEQYNDVAHMLLKNRKNPVPSFMDRLMFKIYKLATFYLPITALVRKSFRLHFSYFFSACRFRLRVGSCRDGKLYVSGGLRAKNDGNDDVYHDQRYPLDARLLQSIRLGNEGLGCRFSLHHEAEAAQSLRKVGTTDKRIIQLFPLLVVRFLLARHPRLHAS